MSTADRVELEGTILRIYSFVAKSNRPIGANDIMRGAHINSSGLTYKHLQRLENLGLVAKDDYGNYILKQKIPVKDFTWIGDHLVPRMTVYAIVFAAILVTEFVVFAIHYSVETYEFKVFFLILGMVTALAFLFFTLEGLRMIRKMNRIKE